MIPNKWRFIQTLFITSYILGITTANSREQELKCQPNCHDYPPVSGLVEQLNYMTKHRNGEEHMVRDDWIRDQRLAVNGINYRLNGISHPPTIWNLWGWLPSFNPIHLQFPIDPKNVSILSTRTVIDQEEGGVIEYVYMHKNPVTDAKCTLHVSRNPNDARTHLMDQVKMYQFIHGDTKE